MLVDVLQQFRAKTVLATDAPSADTGWRERTQDDLVLALASRQAENEWVRDEWLDQDCVP